MTERIQFEKIEMPPPEVFYREYMCKLRPVVLTDVFREDPIRYIDSKAKVVEAWGQERIAVQDEYATAYRNATSKEVEPGTGVEPEITTIADYYGFVADNPGTKKMCIEFPCSPAIRQTYRVPEVCRSRAEESTRFVNQCFIGNARNHALIHFDKAGLHGFLYQVFGRKRFIIFPHSASPKLAPFTQMSGWNLEAFSDSDRHAFLEFTGGAEIILEPGDCMFVPSLCWHYVSYLEDSMSISLRFRRPHKLTLLLNALFPDWYMQGIAYKMMTAENAPLVCEDILREITSTGAEPHINGVARVRAMRALAKRIHARLFPEMPAAPYTLDLEEHFPNPLSKFLDSDHPDRPVYE